MSFTKKSLITISTAKLTVGIVAGAFVIGQQQGQIKQWIKKCMFSYNIDKRPGVNDQMTLYLKLATYLQHDVPLDHVEEWKTILNSKYIPPSVDKLDWTNVFEKEPILCENIDLTSLKVQTDSTDSVKSVDIKPNTATSKIQPVNFNSNLIKKVKKDYSGQGYVTQSKEYSSIPTTTTTQFTNSYAAMAHPGHYSAPTTTHPADYSTPPPITLPAHYSAPPTPQPGHYSTPPPPLTIHPAHYSAPPTKHPSHYSVPPPTTYTGVTGQLPSGQPGAYYPNQPQAVTSQTTPYYTNLYGNQQAAPSQTTGTAAAYDANYYQYYGGSGQAGTSYGGQGTVNVLENQYAQGQGTYGTLPYNTLGQPTVIGTSVAQDQTASYAQTNAAYGTQYVMPGATSQIDSSAPASDLSSIPVPEDENEIRKNIFFSVPEDEDEIRKNIFFYDFPKELSDEHLKSIFNLIGEVKEFSRDKDAADFCNIKMKDASCVFKMFRVLNGFKTDKSDVTWKVNVVNARLFTKPEKKFGKNLFEETKICERIKAIIDPVINPVITFETSMAFSVNHEKKKRSRSRSMDSEPTRDLDKFRKNRSRSRSPEKRKTRSNSRTKKLESGRDFDKAGIKRSRSRSQGKRNRRSRSRSRNLDTSQALNKSKKNRSRSRSPGKRRRSRSRSKNLEPIRDLDKFRKNRSRSRSPDIRKRRSKSKSKSIELPMAYIQSRKNRPRSSSPGKRKKRSRSRSPDKRKRSKSPKRRRSRSGSPRRRSRSPERQRRSNSRSPRRKKSRSPRRNNSRSPDRTQQIRLRRVKRQMLRTNSPSSSFHSVDKSSSIDVQNQSVSLDKKIVNPHPGQSRSHDRSGRKSSSVDKTIKSISSDHPFVSEDKRSIEVDNITISLSKSILNPILGRCGSKKMNRPPGLILPDTNCVTEFVFNTQWTAAIIAKLLNGFRFPDRHLKVKLKVDEEVEKVSKDREEFTNNRLEQLLHLNQDIFVGNVQTHIYRKGVYDIFGYKTRPCMNEDCSSRNRNCGDYHNIYEQRRDLRFYSYSEEECPKAKRGECPEGDECDKAHTSVERAYHMRRIHQEVCPYDGLNDEKCPRNYCIYAHAETPEVLYSSSWRDVHMSGLGQTFEYLVGAVHNLRHIETTKVGVYVIVVSPSQYMCRWLFESVQDLVKDYRLKSAVITDTKFSCDGAKILFGTPENLMSLLRIEEVEITGTLAAIIWDDSSLLLASYLQEMKLIARYLTTGRKYTHTSLNHVVVSDINYEEEVDTWSYLLNTSFIVLGPLNPGLSPEHAQSPLDTKNKVKQGVGSEPSTLLIPNRSTTSEKESCTSHLVSRSSTPHEEKTKAGFEIEGRDIQNTSSRMNERSSDEKSPAAVIAVCKKLNDLCDYMGFIGHSLRAIIGEARAFVNDRDKMLKVFMESDSIMVMDMAVTKLKKDASEATDQSSKEKLQLAFNQTKALVEFLKAPAANDNEAKEKEAEKPFYGLDIKELATVTYNKDPTILFKLIKDCLKGEGVDATDNKVKDIFNEVTTEHFRMGSQSKPVLASVNVPKPQIRSQEVIPTSSQSQSSNQRSITELLASLRNGQLDAMYNQNKSSEDVLKPQNIRQEVPTTSHPHSFNERSLSELLASARYAPQGEGIPRINQSREGYEPLSDEPLSDHRDNYEPLSDGPLSELESEGEDFDPLTDIASRGGSSWDSRNGPQDREIPRSDHHREHWEVQGGPRRDTDWDRPGELVRNRSPPGWESTYPRESSSSNAGWEQSQDDIYSRGNQRHKREFELIEIDD